MRGVLFSLLLLLFATPWLGPEVLRADDSEARWDFLEVGPWCTHEGTFDLRWQVSGPAKQYRINVRLLGDIGFSDSEEVGLARASCQRFRDAFGPVLVQNEFVEVVVTAFDPAHGSIERTALLGMLASAPADRIGRMAIFTRLRVLTAAPLRSEEVEGEGLYITYPQTPESMQGPARFEAMALGRYRETGGTEWHYFLPNPYCFNTCHSWQVSGLTPDTEYEVEAAWAWYKIRPGEDSNRVSVPRPSMYADTEWWKEHNDPQALNWSEREIERTFAEPTIALSTSANSIRLSWPRGEVSKYVYVRSADWPGVLWSEAHNSYPWDRLIGQPDAEEMTATLGGLPSDTSFEIEVRADYPGDLPTELAARLPARTDVGAQPLVPEPADPGGVTVSTHDGDIIISWLEHEGTSTLVRMARSGSDFAGWSIKPRVNRMFQWDSWMPSELRKQRVRFEYGPFAEGTSWWIFVNRYPANWNFERPSVQPYMCMMWEVEVGTPAREPSFGNWGFSYTLASLNSTVKPGNIGAIERLWNYCALGQPTAH